MNSNTADEKEIAQKAYRLWEAEGRPEGRDVAHWHQAEQDVSEPVTQPVAEEAPDIAPDGASDLDPAAASDIEPAADPDLASEAGIAPAETSGEVAKPKRTRKPKVVADESVSAEPKAKTTRRRKTGAPDA